MSTTWDQIDFGCFSQCRPSRRHLHVRYLIECKSSTRKEARIPTSADTMIEWGSLCSVWKRVCYPDATRNERSTGLECVTELPMESNNPSSASVGLDVMKISLESIDHRCSLRINTVTIEGKTSRARQKSLLKGQRHQARTIVQPRLIR